MKPESDEPKKEFLIRSYTANDEFKINAMFNEVFCQNRDISHWHWKYRDNPYGSHYISLAVTSENTLAAHFAGYPMKLYCCTAEKLNPTEHTIFHAGDKMTRPQFRSAGFGKNALLTKIFMHFTEVTTPVSLFGFGFMAHHSLRFGLLLLNYVIIEQVAYRRLDCSMLSGLKSNRFKKFAKNIRTETVTVIDKAWTDLFCRAALLYKCLVKRDAAYLRWRYLQRPDRDYLVISVKKGPRLAGWSVFYREANKIVWGDALFDSSDPDCVKAVLLHLRKQPLAHGTEFIECWFPERPGWWDALLRGLGFKSETEPNKLHFCIGNFSDAKLPETIKENFYYTMGDSDLF